MDQTDVEEPQPVETRPTKVLIIEDESLVAADLRNCLAKFGYEVCGPVNSGIDAFREVEDAHPDIALIDINIKGNMDGTEVAQVLRDRYNIPIIYVTGYAGERTLEKVKPTDPSGYIVKPFNERELHTVIELALHKESSRNHLEVWNKWLATTLSSIGDAIIATDGTQKILFMNPSAEELTGWRLEEALGVDLAEVLKVKLDNLHGTTLDRLDEFPPNHLALARVKNALLQNRDLVHSRIDYTVTPITDDSGNCSGVVVVARDAPSVEAMNNNWRAN